MSNLSFRWHFDYILATRTAISNKLAIKIFVVGVRNFRSLQIAHWVTGFIGLSCLWAQEETDQEHFWVAVRVCSGVSGCGFVKGTSKKKGNNVLEYPVRCVVGPLQGFSISTHQWWRAIDQQLRILHCSTFVFWTSFTLTYDNAICY